MFLQLDDLVRQDLDKFAFTTRQRRMLLFVLDFSFRKGKEACLVSKLEDVEPFTRISKGNLSGIKGIVNSLTVCNVLLATETPESWWVFRILPDSDYWDVPILVDWNCPGLVQHHFALCSMNDRGVQDELFARLPDLKDARVQVSVEGALKRAKALGVTERTGPRVEPVHSGSHIGNGSRIGNQPQGAVPESGTDRIKVAVEATEQAVEARFSFVPESGTDARKEAPTLAKVPESGTSGTTARDVQNVNQNVKDFLRNVHNVTSGARADYTAHLVDKMRSLLPEYEFQGKNWRDWQPIIANHPELLDEKLSALKQFMATVHVGRPGGLLWTYIKKALRNRCAL